MSMLISRKYEVLGPLGQGGMGVVYKVRHVVLDTILALKVLPRDLMENPDMVSRFYREARVMARLRHPNIVRVLDIEHDEELGFHYFVMEYIQGKTLRAYLQEKGALPLPEMLTLATQVARALVYAHAHTPPIVHRDIKPANIMIEDGSSRVVVMDFGIAKELGDGEMTKSGVVLGTLKYSPPEQLRNEPLDGSADVYALGMVMYEAYTGGHLFAGIDEAGVIGKVLYDTDENDPPFSPSTPPLFAALVKKAVAKSRERRYLRMEELLHDIDACFASLSEDATIPLALPKETEPSKRNTAEAPGEHMQAPEEAPQPQLIDDMLAQLKEARARAVAAGAEKLAAVLLQQGEEQETLGHKFAKEGNGESALNAYRTALDFFTKAREEIEVAATLQTAEQARQAMQTAKVEAERVGARERARTFYRRALAIQSQADEQWDALAYQQAREFYDEARTLFVDAQELATRETLKVEAEAARTKALTAKEGAVQAEAEEFAPAVFLDASGYERQADTAMSQEEFLSGREAYLQAQTAYERAAQEATRVRQAGVAESAQKTGGARSERGATESARRFSAASASLEKNVQLRGGRQGDEDRWEIGEKIEASASGAQPLPTRQKSRRTPLLIAGALAVLALAGWFGRSMLLSPTAPPVQVTPPPRPTPKPQPPPVLKFSQVEPREDAVKITAGKSLAFAVQVAGAEPLKYQWTLEGSPVSEERRWMYQSSTKEKGDTTKTVRVQVSDQHGQSVEKSWQVTVAAVNQPPRLIAVTPSKATVELVDGAEQTFRLEAADPEQEKLAYAWSVDEKKSGTQPTFTWKARGEGQHRVKAVVQDQEGLSVSQEWQVAVAAPPAPPKPPPAPPNVAPRIAQKFPAESAVSMQEGGKTEFSALALDPDGEEVFYRWSVDGKQVAQGNRFAYVAGTKGQHRIALEVTDKGGLKDASYWDVNIEAMSAAPRVAMYTPHKNRLQLYAHLSRFFGVEVETPGVIEPSIRYAWKIDGRPAAGRELLEFKDQPPGKHNVEVTATGPSGASVSHRWVVDVEERQGWDDEGFSGPPHLEMFELDNEVSADRKQVVVKGKLRNVSDREAENIIVWISALNAQQGTVSRRLVLPSPQTLAPEKITTFAVAFTNRSEISDFRVEVVSK